MDRKWIWLIPYLNGIIVGTILLVTDGFDLKAVIGPWLFIGLVFFVYTCILRALPVRGHTPWPHMRDERAFGPSRQVAIKSR